MSHLYQKGTLRARARSNNLITEAVLLASSYADESWADIEIITLNQHARDQAIESLADKVLYTLDHSMEDQIRTLTKIFLLSACEFVRFDDNKIVIAVDRDVVDDDAIDHALHLLTRMDSFDPGTLKQF